MLTGAIIALVISAAVNIAQAIEVGRLRKLIEPFDHDHDGKPGG